MVEVVRVHKTELKVSTVWTVEKFEQKLLAMRQLYEKAEASGTETTDDEDEDVFCDADDAWVADSPLSDLSTTAPIPHQ